MSQEKLKDGAQRQRVYQAALLQAEIEDLPYEIDEMVANIEKEKSQVEPNSRSWELIKESENQQRHELYTSLRTKKEELKNLQKGKLLFHAN